MGMGRLGAFGLAGLPGVWFDRLTRNAGWGSVGGCCWVPAGDAGMAGVGWCSRGCGLTRSFGDCGPAHHERGVGGLERKTGGSETALLPEGAYHGRLGGTEVLDVGEMTLWPRGLD